MRKWLRTFWRVITFPIWFPFWLLRAIGRAVMGIVKQTRAFIVDEPEDSTLPETIDRAFSDPGGVFDHINALRKHLFRAVLGLALTTILSFIFTIDLINFLAQPVGGLEKLTAVGITEQISIFMRVALLSGVALAFPYIVLELWLFAAPGLHSKARVYSLLSIPVVAIFFVGGMAFTYYVMLPVAIQFLIGVIPGIETLVTPSSIFDFSITVMFWMGIAFEFPVASFVLAKIGLVRGSTLLRQWRIAIVVVAALSALITPTPDIGNMLLVMFPLLALYFLGAFLAILAQPKPIST